MMDFENTTPDQQKAASEWHSVFRNLAYAHIKLPIYPKVLDIGCGMGELIKYLRSQSFDAVGIDRNLPINHKDLNIVQGDASKMPFDDKSFDIVHSNNIYDSWLYRRTHDNVENILDEVMRVLKKDGVYIIFDANFPKINREKYKEIFESENYIRIFQK